MTGERDPRSEDRQLLLDAVMSAADTLVVTYAGFDEHSGQERPPAVPLGELVDAVRATASGPAVERLVTRHPLQPFDARNLGATPAGLPPLLPEDRPFSHDPAALHGARRALAGRETPPALSAHLLDPPERGDVDLADLLRFFDNPARAYLRDRLGLVLPEVPEVRGEGIPIELDGLQTWAVGDRVLTAVLAGRDAGATIDAELWRGELPPGELGARTMATVTERVQHLCEVAWQVTGLGGWGQPLPREVVDVDVVLPSGRRLTGTVPGMVGHRALQVTYSSVRARQRLRSWVTSLALSAALGPDASSHVIGRRRWGRADGFVHVTHGPHDPAVAGALLDQLVQLRDRGLRAPVPLPPETALRWASSYLQGSGDQAAASIDATREWQTNDGYERSFPKEQDDPSQLFVHGAAVPLAAILGTPADDERWAAGVDSRLGQLALRVWGPVLQGGVERMERV